MQNPEFRFNIENEKNLPTNRDLLTMLKNCKLNRAIKFQLEENFDKDPWVKRQLVRIFLEVDRALNLEVGKKDMTQVDTLWSALNTDWKTRRKLPLIQRSTGI